MTSFTHARSQRYELELRFVPPEIEVIALPRPPDPRDLFDFSGARELIDAAYELANDALDRAAVPPTHRRADAAASAAAKARLTDGCARVAGLVGDRGVGWRASRSRACRRA